MALRFVGFTLHEIKALLTAEVLPLTVALTMQGHIIRQRRAQLDRALRAIERAQSVVSAGGDPSLWEPLRVIIEVMKMENTDHSWTEEYYTPAAQAKIAQRAAAMSKEQIEEGQRAWTQLIAEVEAAKGGDPASEAAQELASRWKALVQGFTGGDREIAQGVNKLWSDSSHWPKDFKRPWSDEAEAFIQAAIRAKSKTSE